MAIKFLLPYETAEFDEDTKHRFFDEAIAVDRIHHAGIVKIFDFGYYQSKDHAIPFLLMEFLRGESLSDRLQRQRQHPQSFRSSLTFEFLRQIANVMAATHDAGIVHRDLKPSNMMIVTDAELRCGQRIKLLDFGVAKLSATIGRTHASHLLGTPYYIAPEQWIDSAKVDSKADVYALGCISFEMCCGRVPFRGTLYALANQHMNQVPERVRSLAPEIPPEVDDAIAAALAKHPADRPSMKELEKVFAAAAAESAVLQLPLPPSAEPCEHRVNQIASSFRVPGKSTAPVVSRRVDEAGDPCWESIAYGDTESRSAQFIAPHISSRDSSHSEVDTAATTSDGSLLVVSSTEPEISGSAMRRNGKQSGTRTQLNLASASDDEPPEVGLDAVGYVDPDVPLNGLSNPMASGSVRGIESEGAVRKSPGLAPTVVIAAAAVALVVILLLLSIAPPH